MIEEGYNGDIEFIRLKLCKITIFFKFLTNILYNRCRSLDFLFDPKIKHQEELIRQSTRFPHKERLEANKYIYAMKCTGIV